MGLCIREVAGARHPMVFLVITKPNKTTLFPDFPILKISKNSATLLDNTVYNGNWCTTEYQQEFQKVESFNLHLINKRFLDYFKN